MSQVQMKGQLSVGDAISKCPVDQLLLQEIEQVRMCNCVTCTCTCKYMCACVHMYRGKCMYLVHVHMHVCVLHAVEEKNIVLARCQSP